MADTNNHTEALALAESMTFSNLAKSYRELHGALKAYGKANRDFHNDQPGRHGHDDLRARRASTLHALLELADRLALEAPQ